MRFRIKTRINQCITHKIITELPFFIGVADFSSLNKIKSENRQSVNKLALVLFPLGSAE